MITVMFGLGSLVCGADSKNAAPAEPSRLRLAFSAGLVGDINRNDARASIIAWCQALMDQRKVVAGTESSIFDRSEDLCQGILDEQIDGAAVMTDEFFSRPAGLKPEAVYLSLKNGKATEQYVLLVHQGSGITNTAGLKGRNLEIHKSARTSLAGPWIDTILANQGLGLAEVFFGKIDRAEKASRVVLRVFFRQTDASIATREAFETMCELNPQLRKDLRVLVTSPEVVPSVFFLRPGFSGRLRQELEAAMLTLHETIAGRQALTVFQGDKMEKHPLSSLGSADDLLTAAARARSVVPGTAAKKPPSEQTR